MDTLKRKMEIIFAFTDRNKEVSEQYTKLWDEFKYLIKTINDNKEVEYQKDFMKIQFNSTDNLLLNKVLKFHKLTIVVRSVFQENNKYYPQVLLDE